MMSLAGVMGWWNTRTGAPSPEDVTGALHQYAVAADSDDLDPVSSTTAMLLADVAANFSHIRILGAKENAGLWSLDALVRVQTRRTSPVDLKIQFHLMQQRGDWSIMAAKLLQG
ncbi:MAG: hypothetical protein E6Q98_03255 [Rhodospirillaceae bacterium]|nr:MAG: hypothetical protein E6Q98_03255 [Rhodospirillaceae bacterium]